eukprot:GEMP01017242.1.p1 GENE.GEMP01017242.1~~GEMP01017242.1.p1  ORF type:complete len:694 (+),score=144.47 GEMP01017242.1:252-2333(+)
MKLAWILCMAPSHVLADSSSSNDELAMLREELRELRTIVMFQQDKSFSHRMSRRHPRRAMPDGRRLSGGKWYENQCPVSGDSGANKTPGGIQSDILNVSGMDSAWLLTTGAMVMFMQAGFAMLECGTVRAKNAQHVLLKNVLDVCVGTIAWWLVGFSWAYGYTDSQKRLTDANGNPCYETVGRYGSAFAGNSFYGLGDVFHFCSMGASSFFTALDNVKVGDAVDFTRDSPEHCISAAVPRVDKSNVFLTWFSQWPFCAIAATIVCGGVAERVKLRAYVLMSACMSGFIYPIVVASMRRGNGWTTYYDFAGSGIVHMTGGVAALLGATIAGPRKGRFENPAEFGPHNMPFVVLGTFILWFGWYGFNPGSTLGMSDGLTAMTAALAAVNTTISAATCGLVSFIIETIKTRGKYDVSVLCNGILAGLVSVTASCGNVQPWGAFIIGLIGGHVFRGTSYIITRLRIDDPLDAFAIHGACGFWGAIAVPIFDLGGDGFFYGLGDGSSVWYNTTTSKWEGVSKGKQFGVQLITLLAIIGWVGVWSMILFGGLRAAGWLTEDSIVQKVGADTSFHSPVKAYVVDSKAMPGVAPPPPPSKNQDILDRRKKSRASFSLEQTEEILERRKKSRASISSLPASQMEEIQATQKKSDISTTASRIQEIQEARKQTRASGISTTSKGSASVQAGAEKKKAQTLGRF